ncbi:MAG TPA: DUF839 domain-containing protein [Ferruginibacter sp.]|nr:DUF839 domain-containing protein [Ferruginibacter sp.]
MKNLYSAATACLFIFLLFSQETKSQTIGTFNSVTPGAQSQSLVIPSTHTFQRIIKSGDALTAGGTLGNDLDFTGYVPIAGNSRNGYLSISSESTPAAVCVMTVTYNVPTHTWVKSNSGNVTFPAAAFGTTPVIRFCSGTVTPNGTIMVSEENVAQGDTNGDGYNDDGWIIEIDPATRTVMESDATHTGVDKLWAIGRQARENAAITPDNTTLYTGADNGAANSFVYKFVANTPGNFSSGQLYVLVTTAALGTGTWKAIANTTQANRNSTIALSTAAPAAYSFNGVEDMEVGPDGKVYFTAKGPGRIYRFNDNGATVSNLEVFVENATYDVDPGPGVSNAAWGIGNDNLAFDGEGNLWVLQDGANNHIWVVGPTHTAATPAVRLFGKTPAGAEPTGISFTPDKKFMFLSLQHPNAGNAAAQLDAAGVSVVFNTHTTLVIARTENLGPTATLPISFLSFDAVPTGNGVSVNWSVANITNHDYFTVERSVNGTDFEEIHRNDEDILSNPMRTFSTMDNNLPGTDLLYYRIKQCDINGSCRYSDIKTVKFATKSRIANVYPQPAQSKLNIQYYSDTEGPATLLITDINGKTVLNETRSLSKGTQVVLVNTAPLGSGIYLITITDKDNQKTTQKFIKE